MSENSKLSENVERKTLAGKVKKLAGSTQKSIVSAMDRNGDGKLNAADFGLDKESLKEFGEKTKKTAAKAGLALKTGRDKLGQAISDTKTEMELKTLRPVFRDELPWLAIPDVDSDDMLLNVTRVPSLVCVVGHDKRRDESVVCRGSVGYWTTIKDVEILNLYEEYAKDIGIELYPNVAQTFYYIDPYRTNCYVCLDDYFDYFKRAHVSELERLARDLGAKRFRIVFKEQKKTFVKHKKQAEVKAADKKGSITHEQVSTEGGTTEVAADITFEGCGTPREPQLVYFKNERDIEELVRARMESGNPIKSKDYHFRCSRLSGMTEKAAAKLDGVFAQLKCSGTATISSEAQRESRTELEYHIEF